MAITEGLVPTEKARLRGWSASRSTAAAMTVLILALGCTFTPGGGGGDGAAEPALTALEQGILSDDADLPGIDTLTLEAEVDVEEHASPLVEEPDSPSDLDGTEGPSAGALRAAAVGVSANLTASDLTRAQTAPCPATYKLVGGGFQLGRKPLSGPLVSPAPVGVVIEDSRPIGETWVAVARERPYTTVAWRLKVWSMCVRLPGVGMVTETKSDTYRIGADTGQLNDTAVAPSGYGQGNPTPADCTAGFDLVGGGFASGTDGGFGLHTGMPEGVVIEDSQPANPRHWYAVAREKTPTPIPWFLTVFSICAHTTPSEPHLEVRTKFSDPIPGGPATATSDACESGWTQAGGGFDLGHGTGSPSPAGVVMEASRPEGNTGKWTAVAREHQATPVAWDLRSWQQCIRVAPTIVVGGLKFDDHNGNAKRETADEGLAGWTFVAIADDGVGRPAAGARDGKAEAGEPIVSTAVSDSTGHFEFTNPKIPAGNYVICELAQTDWEQSYPRGGNSCGLVSGAAANGWSGRINTSRSDLVFANHDVDDLKPCNTESQSGHGGVTSNKYQMGVSSGTFTLAYRTYGIEDQIEVFYQGARIWRTDGFVKTPDFDHLAESISFAGTSTEILVVVTGNLTNPGTSWDYIVNCPNPGSTTTPAPTLIAASSSLSCVGLAGGRARCWGSSFLQGNSVQRLSPTVVEASPGVELTGVNQIAVGGDQACAVMDDHRMMCWGGNTNGQLGTGNTTAAVYPAYVKSAPGVDLIGVLHIAASQNYTCAVLDSGVLKCWGSNTYGNLGDGTTTPRPYPTQVSLNPGVTAVATSGTRACAVVAGNVRCWGNGSPNPSAGPAITGVIRDIATGDNHACVLVNGGVKCWGSNFNRQLGNNSSADSSTPVDVHVSATALLGDVASISSQFRHTCALTNAGEVRCWGRGTNGALGTGLTDDAALATPVRVVAGSHPALAGASAVAAGASISCAVVPSSLSGVMCWGQGQGGGLGNGITSDALWATDTNPMP